MKKTVSLALAIIMVLILASCGSNADSETTAAAAGESVNSSTAAEQAGTNELQSTDANAQSETAAQNGDVLQSNAAGSSEALKNVNGNNYASVAKAIFGIEPIEKEGWALEFVESPNGVSNLDIVYSGNSEKGKALAEEYYNAISAIATDGIYSQDFNDDYSGVIKGEKSGDFATYFEEECSEFYGVTSAMWIYDFGGKSIQLSLTVNLTDTTVELILTALG